MRWAIGLLAAACATSAAAQTKVPVELDCFTADALGGAMGRLHMWPVAHGVATGTLGQVWANTETGQWAFTITDGNGFSCILLAGEDFGALPPPPAGEDS